VIFFKIGGERGERIEREGRESSKSTVFRNEGKIEFKD